MKKIKLYGTYIFVTKIKQYITKFLIKIFFLFESKMRNILLPDLGRFIVF